MVTPILELLSDTQCLISDHLQITFLPREHSRLTPKAIKVDGQIETQSGLSKDRLYETGHCRGRAGPWQWGRGLWQREGAVTPDVQHFQISVSPRLSSLGKSKRNWEELGLGREVCVRRQDPQQVERLCVFRGPSAG